VDTAAAAPIYLVRHARPQVQAGTCYGQSDVLADPAETVRAARDLVSILPHNACVYTSGLRRADTLAAALAGMCPGWSTPQVDKRLQEMHFGEWEMRPWDDIGAPTLTDWTDAFATYRCGGGESVTDLLERVRSAWQELRAQDRPTVWVTHAGVISAVRHLQRYPTSRPRALDWPAPGVDFGASCVLGACAIS
jgi:alpha-ribazole phosphatase